jgi:hypothetical protein
MLAWTRSARAMLTDFLVADDIDATACQRSRANSCWLW